MVRCKTYFDILNCLGVTHECDRRTDRRTDGQTDGHSRGLLRCAAKYLYRRNSRAYI